MSSNREKLKKEAGSSLNNDHKEVKPFGAFTPMQQERIITHMNTIGSKKEEMRRVKDMPVNKETGMPDIL